MKRIETKTKRLVLRALKSTDYQAWYDAHVNGGTKQSKWDRAPMKPEICSLKWFNKIKKEHEDLANKDDYYRYYVFEKKSGVMVGQIDSVSKSYWHEARRH